MKGYDDAVMSIKIVAILDFTHSSRPLLNCVWGINSYWKCQLLTFTGLSKSLLVDVWLHYWMNILRHILMCNGLPAQPHSLNVFTNAKALCLVLLISISVRTLRAFTFYLRFWVQDEMVPLAQTGKMPIDSVNGPYIIYVSLRKLRIC